MIARGASLAGRNREGGTPLHDAALAGHSEIINLLLARGAAIDCRDSSTGATPLMEAVSLGHADAAALLLKRGADPKLADFTGRTALSRARQAQEPLLVQLLEGSLKSAHKGQTG